jgi:biopolymer transport protein TolQ
MQFTLTGLWAHMGLFARLIVLVLAVMSLASLGVTAERLLFFFKSKGDSVRYAQSLEKMLASSRLQEAATKSSSEVSGYLGRVIDAGLRAFTRAEGARGEFVVESVGRALERQAQREIQTLKRGQGVVATVSSTAPFVGLLGTVMGIVSSFEAMASSGSGGLGTVSAGIAEALVTTAFGLIVAIPAVMAFNWMQSWVDGRAVDLAESSNELLDTVARSVGAEIGDRQVKVESRASGGPPGRSGDVSPEGAE